MPVKDQEAFWAGAQTSYNEDLHLKVADALSKQFRYQQAVQTESTKTPEILVRDRWLSSRKRKRMSLLALADDASDGMHAGASGEHEKKKKQKKKKHNKKKAKKVSSSTTSPSSSSTDQGGDERSSQKENRKPQKKILKERTTARDKMQKTFRMLHPMAPAAGRGRSGPTASKARKEMMVQLAREQGWSTSLLHRLLEAVRVAN